MIPLPPFDPSSDEPIYRQIVDLIKQKIRSGELAAGQRIPPTRELAGQLGLNRATIAAAYEILEAEGLIRGHVGRGSFVAAGAAPAGIAWEDRFAPAVSLLSPMSGGESGISFASARPAEDLFPIGEFRDSVRRGDPAVGRRGHPAVGFARIGYAPLRHWSGRARALPGDAAPVGRFADHQRLPAGAGPDAAAC